MALDFNLFSSLHRHVQINNDGAIRFYEKFGFEIVEEKKNYYKRIEPADAYVLQKSFRKKDKCETKDQNGENWSKPLCPHIIKPWIFFLCVNKWSLYSSKYKSYLCITFVLFLAITKRTYIVPAIWKKCRWFYLQFFFLFVFLFTSNTKCMNVSVYGIFCVFTHLSCFMLINFV